MSPHTQPIETDTQLAYSVWCENDGESDRWHWQTMRDAGDHDEVLDAGIEDTKELAMLCVNTSLRNHGGYLR